MAIADGDLITVDDRRRVTLGAVARHNHYVVYTEPGGTIVLEPAVVVPSAVAVPPQAQEQFMLNPERARLLTDPAVRGEMEPAPDWLDV